MTALESVVISPETTWHSAVEVESADFTHIVSYKFKSIPPYSNQPLEKAFHHQIVINARDYEFWSYRFTTGANVILSFHLTQSLNFLIIKGSSIFDSWSRGNTAAKTEKQFYTSQFTNWQFTAGEEDVYYFIWDNSDNRDAITGSAVFDIQMNTYDFSQAVEICNDNPDCTFVLERHSEEVVIIYALDSVQGHDIYTIRYYVHPRLDYYWTIFGIFLGIFGAIVVTIFLVVFFSRRKQEHQTTSDVSSVSEPFLRNNSGSENK
jgi:hypothetical protein